jgi:hypothetical protein
MQTWLKQIPKDVNFLRTPAAMNKFGNKARVRIMFLKRLACVKDPFAIVPCDS